MERIAFIDLGSNSVRFVIYEISDTGSYRLIYQEKFHSLKRKYVGQS